MCFNFSTPQFYILPNSLSQSLANISASRAFSVIFFGVCTENCNLLFIFSLFFLLLECSSSSSNPFARPRIRQECTKKEGKWKVNAIFRKINFARLRSENGGRKNCILLAFHVHRDITEEVEKGLEDWWWEVMHFMYKDTRILCRGKISLRFSSLKLCYMHFHAFAMHRFSRTCTQHGRNKMFWGG